VSGVAVVVDSVSDLSPEQAAAAGITVVPLTVTFGDKEYRAGVDMSAEQFWTELTAPGAPFPKTAAASPGAFKETFEKLFEEGADEVLYVGASSKLSATLGSAKVAADMLAGKRIHVIDSKTASMGAGLLALYAVERAAAGMSGEKLAADVQSKVEKVDLYVVLETLEYLKRGGRISPARAAIGNVLSVKPIITVVDGVVETADRPRTRGRARERLLELLAATKPQRICVLHGQASEVTDFADELAKLTKVPRDKVMINLIGASVGPHVGPGAYGAVVMSG
jgi:DegV family protein with EDD domain